MDKNKKLFPQRLWELIHDQKYNFCLRWSPDGQRVYLNRNEFESHYLKTPNNQFHTQKAISFVRQMNMYGFRKVDDCYYENDNFKRNCPHLLKNMVRRHSNRSFFSSPPTNNENQQSTINNNHHHHHHQQQQHLHQHHIHNLNQISLNNNTTTTSTNTNVCRNSPNDDRSLDEDNGEIIQQLQLTSTPISSQIQPQPLFVREQQASSPVELLERQVAAVVQNAQNFVEATNNVESLPLEAAAMVAALNSSNNTTIPYSPLASSLYLRLAALNFGQTQQVSNNLTAQTLNSTTNMNNLYERQTVKTAGSNMTPSAQLIGPPSTTTTMNSPSLSPLLASYGLNSLNSSQNSSANTTMSSSSSSSISNGSISNTNNNNNNQTNSRTHRTPNILNQQQQTQHSAQFETMDIPMGLQQSLAARQMIQQTLVRSLLQIKQPPLLLQQNLLASLQNCDPNLLLETLVNMNNNININNPTNIGANNLDQVDLASSLEFLASQRSPQRPSAPNSRDQANDFGDNNNNIQLSPRFNGGNINHRTAVHSPQQMNIILQNNSPGENHLVEENEDDRIEVDDNNYELGDGLGINNYNNFENVFNINGNNRSPPSRYQQQETNQGDINETVLNLAKPFSKNSSV